MNHGVVIGNEPYLGGDSASLIDAAVAAEDAGWDGVFLGDHLCPHGLAEHLEYQSAFDPWITLAGIAARTDEITLGTWVSPLPRRQPWQVARDLATLDRLADGRVLLGTGLGSEPDYTAFGRPWEPRALGRRYDEALDVVTGLWEGEPFSYDGDHFTLEEATLLPTPVQEPRIPIVAGCWWPNEKPFHRGARWDGIMPNWPSLFGRDPEGDDASAGPADDASAGPADDVRAMMEYYHGITDDPGEVVLPADPVGGSTAYLDACTELGATWLLTTHVGALYADTDSAPDAESYSVLERIEQGPPSDP